MPHDGGVSWLAVLVIIAILSVLAILWFRWFQRYRFTDQWRKSEFRGAAFGFMLWFGGLFGHRLPPPPQTRIEYASGKDPQRSANGLNGSAEAPRPPLTEHTADEEHKVGGPLG